MAKYSRKVEQRAWLLGIEDIAGWFLVAKDDDLTEWHIAWLDPFATKKSALKWAANNRWPKPYRALRGRITVRDIQIAGAK